MVVEPKCRAVRPVKVRMCQEFAVEGNGDGVVGGGRNIFAGYRRHLLKSVNIQREPLVTRELLQADSLRMAVSRKCIYGLESPFPCSCKGASASGAGITVYPHAPVLYIYTHTYTHIHIHTYTAL